MCLTVSRARDWLVGGLGNDIYIVDNAGDVVTEAKRRRHRHRAELRQLHAGRTTSKTSILTGSALNGTGNGLDNIITGNALGNPLNGGAGADRLIGGDGRDFMTGGAGADTFVDELNSTKVSSKQGSMSVDVITDFQRASTRSISPDRRQSRFGRRAGIPPSVVCPQQECGDLTFKSL